MLTGAKPALQGKKQEPRKGLWPSLKVWGHQIGLRDSWQGRGTGTIPHPGLSGGVLGLSLSPRPWGQAKPDLVGHLPCVGHRVHSQLHPPAEGLLAHRAREDLAVWGASGAASGGALPATAASAWASTRCWEESAQGGDARSGEGNTEPACPDLDHR